MDLDVYVSPTCTNGARCGDRRRYLAWKERAERSSLFPSGQDIHAVPLRAVTSREREKRPDIGGVKPEEGGMFPRSS